MRTEQEILQGEELQSFLMKCSFDFAFFCERVLGYEIKPFHKEWCDLLMGKDRLAIEAPTGFGKTWIFGIGYTLWQAFFVPGSGSLIVSKVIKTQSARVLEDIKYNIEENWLLHRLKPEGSDKTWTKEKIVCSNNSKIFYSSYSRNVRGLHIDYLFGDEVATFPDKGDGYEIWFQDCMSRVADSKISKIAAVSTPLEPGDLIEILQRPNQGYYSKLYPAVINCKSNEEWETGESIWPERFPMALLKKLEKEQGRTRFQRNYMVNAKAEVEGAIFKLKDIVACYHENVDFSTVVEEDEYVFIGADFALADGPQADFDAYVVVGKRGNLTTIKHMEIWKGWPVFRKKERLLELCEIYKPFQLILDESNVGMDIAQHLLNHGQAAITQKFGSVSRKQVLMVMKIMIDNHQIVIPFPKSQEKLRLVDLLTEQLIGFKEETSEKTKLTTYASRAAHDDLAISLALACKGSSSQEIGRDSFGSGK